MARLIAIASLTLISGSLFALALLPVGLAIDCSPFLWATCSGLCGLVFAAEATK